MSRPVLLCISMLLLSGAAAAEQDLSVNQAEIQVLIDVSGSMKQNDPNNFRKDASQLLIHLLPDKTKASLWLFAKDTKLLTHSEAVDDGWRKQALKASNAIHANGLYTDIETALTTVLKKGFDDDGDRYLLLLSDGMVDISKDIMVSADSRERILSEWIPKLRQRQIKVQTIALSDQADKALLEKLAFDTDGWSEIAQSAEQLQRLFLKMARQAAPKDTVPLANNHFNIDDSIQEFSVLVFKKPDAPSTQLIDPDQKKIIESKDAKNTAWLETAGYDLITIKQPMPGDWQIVAETDPDNQVMILTDLKLQLEAMPNIIGEQDSLNLKLFFTEKGQLIERRDFLDLVTLTLTIDQQETQQIPSSNEQTGFFEIAIIGQNKGKHSLSIVADGKTFQRQIIKEIEVVTSPIRIEKRIDVTQRQVTLKFVPDIALLDSSTLSIAATIHQGQTTETRPVEEQNGEWPLTLDNVPPASSLSIHFNVMVNTLDGSSLTPSLMPITIDDSWFDTPSTPPQPEEDSTAEMESSEKTSLDAEPTITGEAAESTLEGDPKAKDVTTENSWQLTIGLVVLANVLLCGIGFFIYKTLKKAAAKKQQQLLERLSE